MNLRVLAMVPALAVIAGCGGGRKTSPKEPVAPARVTSPAARELLGRVPASAPAVLLIDSPKPFWSLVLSDWGKGPRWQSYRDQLDQDLRALFDQRLGIDVSDVRTALVFVGNPEARELGLMLTGVKGKLCGKASGSLVSLSLDTDNGVEVVAAQNGPLLVIGPRSVAEAIAKQAPHAPAGLAADVFSHGSGAYVAASVDLQSLGPILGNDLGPIAGLTRVTLSQGQSLVLRITGEGTALDRIQKLAEVMLDRMIAEATKKKEEGLAASTAEGVVALVAYHNARYLAAELEPRREDGVLIADYPAGADTAALAVTLIGIMAAVAIPSFMKYIKKSKSTEARQFLEKMAAGARAYAVNGGKGPDGKPGYPASTAITPAKGACCQGGSETCQPDPSLWNTPSWQALQFSVDDPFYYSYEFVNDGQRFHARAYGDLDCDGVYSTFEVTGNLGATEPSDVLEHQPLE